jgi:DNA-binding beta-propeller fold protein YncE
MAGDLVAPASPRTGWLFWLCGLVVTNCSSVACTPTTDLEAAEHVGGYHRVATTQGSAVAVTQDQRIAVVTNRSDGVVSIVRLEPSKELPELVSDAPATQIPFHPLNESKPWAAVIGTDDDTAYVLLRGLSQVVRVSGLHGKAPHVTAAVQVGSEPTSLVISPTGKWLYVANWGEGTVSSILFKEQLEARWDLNSRLVDEALLGPLIGAGEPTSAVWTKTELELHRRPGLAHPRALAITDDGDSDDTDETLYATEFFSQPLPNGGDSALADDLDHSREGVIYPILTSTGGSPPDVNVIPLKAVDVTFTDSEGMATACFPNQLYSAAVSGDRLYVTSVCASPKGPLEAGPAGDLKENNFKTLMHSAVFVVDTARNREVEAERLVLTDALQTSYVADTAAAGEVPPAAQRMALVPNEIVVAAPDSAGNRQAYLSAMGSSAVYPISFAASGTATVGSVGRRFIGLSDDGSVMPTGIAVLSDGRGLVADDAMPGLAVLDLVAQDVLGAKSLSRDWSQDPETTEGELLSDEARKGHHLFATGLGIWSLKGQGWSSCESCHPDGLSDGVTWRFTRGPRRTISLAGTYYRDEPTRRVLLWGANIDEIHDVEVIARNLSGGVGGVLWTPYAETPGKDCRLIYDGGTPSSDGTTPACPAPLATINRANGLNGTLSALSRSSKAQPPCEATDSSCELNGSFDWGHIDAFIRTIRAPHAPTTLDPTSVAKGARLFESKKCNACHAGAGWTLSHMFYAPSLDANGAVHSADPRKAVPPHVLDHAEIDPMLGQLRTRQYSIPAPAAFWPDGGQAGTFRTAPPLDATVDTKLDYLFGQLPVKDGMTPPKALPADQIKCVLRSVGTFPTQPSEGFEDRGVTAGNGAPPVLETRFVLSGTAYAGQVAYGETGFNIPSLVGLATGAPYFHAGNARTLEELFDNAFSGHHGAMGEPSPTPDEIKNLVSYLLSLDETDASMPVAMYGAFNPDLCAQFTLQ